MIPAPTMSVALSSARGGARPIVLTLRVHYEMQCSWPGPGSLQFRFPAGMLPTRLPAGAVLVNGKAASTATSSASPRDVAVGLPPRPQIMCDVIGPGTVTVVFTRAARIGNPKAPGSYLLRGSHAADRFTGRLAITR
jgi:hypothetical protein